jgi:hypothetical protein
MFKGAEHVHPDEPTIGKDQVNIVQSLIEAILKMRN